MDMKTWSVLLVVILPVVTAVWKPSQEERREGLRRGVHYHTKRHMLPTGGSEPKKRHTTQKPPQLRKKPSGHLKPLDEEDMENDEVVSVAVGPPPLRPKYDKIHWKHSPKQNTTAPPANSSATDLVRNVLTQLGREFLTHQVSEDFVFGQYVGHAMKNLTNEQRLSMQHEVLELIVKYQKLNRGEVKVDDTTDKVEKSFVPMLKDMKTEKRAAINETDDNWPDFSNLAKIVG
ncbi:uncharacterized protein LOC135074728 [Ostrinia nubilalis]|uniref:uncharacterized protein LOC135074728 n=1 Tax=Ostrinia nubilalis TaxID=29057 RepID=UPI0030825357